MNTYDIDDKRFLFRVTGFDDVGMVSKPVILKIARYAEEERQQMVVELFCANPDHLYFWHWDEKDLVPLRLERLRRKEHA